MIRTHHGDAFNVAEECVHKKKLDAQAKGKLPLLQHNCVCIRHGRLYASNE